jgi:hypothetical protein
MTCVIGEVVVESMVDVFYVFGNIIGHSQMHGGQIEDIVGSDE